MPKVRDPVDSIRDIQRHLIVCRSRLLKDNNDHEVMTLISEAAIIVDKVFNKLTQVEKSSTNKSISNELNLYKKELEKNIPKIDYHSAIPAMCDCTDLKQVYVIGRKHNMPPEEIDQVIRDAPTNTNLAKAHAALRAKQKPLAVADPLHIQPQVFEDEDTNNSDFEIDETLRKQLGMGE